MGHSLEGSATWKGGGEVPASICLHLPNELVQERRAFCSCLFPQRANNQVQKLPRGAGRETGEGAGQRSHCRGAPGGAPSQPPPATVPLPQNGWQWEWGAGDSVSQSTRPKSLPPASFSCGPLLTAALRPAPPAAAPGSSQRPTPGWWSRPPHSCAALRSSATCLFQSENFLLFQCMC